MALAWVQFLGRDGFSHVGWDRVEYPTTGAEVHESTPTMAASLGIHARTVGLTGLAMSGRPVAGPTSGNACRTRGIGAWGPVDLRRNPHRHSQPWRNSPSGFGRWKKRTGSSPSNWRRATGHHEQMKQLLKRFDDLSERSSYPKEGQVGTASASADRRGPGTAPRRPTSTPPCRIIQRGSSPLSRPRQDTRRRISPAPRGCR